ncbi:MAG: 4Fe-4S binding protein [Candidatus Heimdallarchaeota archaeon]|nr:4Fe-4S binding protein [Candidatus Heimdallarchaeota archaeon]MDH5646047.1 4Fe-4S binding protein [Candidatus Heimdallarchaeota archaeon]
MATDTKEVKALPTIKDDVELAKWTPIEIAKIEGPSREVWDDPEAHNLQDMFGKALRPIMRSRPFQFFLIIPNFIIFFFAAISGFFGTNDAQASLATVLTWIVWWAFLLLMIMGVSRLWCVICPFGAMGEWSSRFSLWGTGNKRFSLNLQWPKSLKNLWLVNSFFIFFLWMDNVFGFGNSPVLTGYFIVVLVVLDVAIAMVYERRSFCRYMCPINGFIGLQGLFAGFEMRSKSSAVCRACRGKWCLKGREAEGGGYGCPMFLYPGGNDTNKYCILCTECLKSCPNNTMRIGIRPPLKDLWTNKSFSFDESFNVIALLGVSTIAPILLIKLVIVVEDLISGGKAEPIHAILSKTILYVLGLVTAFVLVMSIMFVVSKITAPEESFKGAKHYTNIYASALVPLPLMKLIADILDHLLRNGSSVIWVVYNFFADFPQGRADSENAIPISSPFALNNTTIIFSLQALFLTLGFFSSAYVIRKLYENWEPQRKFSSEKEARTATIIMMVLSISITLFNIWALAGPAKA